MIFWKDDSSGPIRASKNREDYKSTSKSSNPESITLRQAEADLFNCKPSEFLKTELNKGPTPSLTPQNLDYLIRLINYLIIKL